METQLQFSGNTVYWKSFKWGEIFPRHLTFQVIPRSRKNIFKMFNGLGLNEELLHYLIDNGIRYIIVPYCGKILKTTVERWLKKGIPSPYCTDKVDQQIILPLDKINLDEDKPLNIIPEKQLSLFGSV